LIHIVTTHVGDDRWIELQLRHVRRHTREAHRTWAALDGAATSLADRFDHVEPSRGRVGANLNHLATLVGAEADPADLLVFLDGDAFPVGDWITAARGWLARFELAAVRRDENLGDPQSHQLFCVTTVGFWQRIGGDWRPGPRWVSYAGRAETDHGARVLRILNGAGLAWHPILRSNRRDLHPLWFGIYGDVVYHHGAGFRAPASRLAGAQFGHLPVPLARAARWRAERGARRASETVYRRLLAGDELIDELMTFPNQAD